MNRSQQLKYHRSTNKLLSVDTALWVNFPIGLQAARLPLTHTHDNRVCVCALQFFRDPWAVYPNTSSRSHPRVKSMCSTSWTVVLDRVQWEHRGRGRQVERDMDMDNQGLRCTFSGDGPGTKPKGDNNGTVEMCKSSWKRSFGSVTKAHRLQERTVARGKLLSGVDTISGASMGLTDVTN